PPPAPPPPPPPPPTKFTTKRRLTRSCRGTRGLVDVFKRQVLNLGGGFGIRYTEEDEPLPATEYVEKIIQAVKENVTRYEFDMPEIWIEPCLLYTSDA
ncbi:hypothetical protein ACQ4LK_24955, partial [Bacillus pumilus]